MLEPMRSTILSGGSSLGGKEHVNLGIKENTKKEPSVEPRIVCKNHHRQDI
jgi:hypothetical protein